MIKTNGSGILLLLLCVIGSGIAHFDSFVVSKLGRVDGRWRCVSTVSMDASEDYIENGYHNRAIAQCLPQIKMVFGLTG